MRNDDGRQPLRCDRHGFALSERWYNVSLTPKEQ